MLTLKLPTADRRLEPYRLTGDPLPAPSKPRQFNRVAFSAAHVVADPLSANDPSGAAAIDWSATLAYRRHLLGLGLGIAEAMDTAQRGMGLGWPEALELIRRTLEDTRDIPGALIFSGCGTDQLDPARRAHAGRRPARLRRAARRHSEARRAHHPHGQPRAGPGGEGPGRLSARVSARARTSAITP